ncbi:hypothetical protein GQ53DRAFT_659724 [Thozetella sp. PMI_491]|nr:hypothetical protein GQ53DRAFT_659724 [Thozetella sp. PMI_491]
MASEPGSAPDHGLTHQANSSNADANGTTSIDDNQAESDYVTKTCSKSADQRPKARTSDQAVVSYGSKLSVQEGQQKGKRKKKKSRGTKKQGTGFEEYYCDPPITPAEYLEERQVYDPAASFPDRIQECIQRYRARRRLNNDQECIFSRYLMLGGIDVTVRQFQSTRNLDYETLEESTKSELREIEASDVIPRGEGDPRFYNPNDAEHWVVDFTGVVSGFLSVRLPSLVGGSRAWIEGGIKVILNFLKYVQLHDVCPEYAADVQCAQDVCNTAIKEMPLITDLMSELPGDFNRAAWSLFYRQSEEDAVFEFDNDRIAPAMSQKQARAIFFATTVAWASPEFCDQLIHANIQVESTFERVFEVLPFEEDWLPSNEIIKHYKHIRDEHGKSGRIHPTASILLQPSTIQDGFDVGELNYQEVTQSQYRDKTRIFLETKLAVRLKPGLKLRLVVSRLNVDLFFIKEVKEVYPTFYTFLPQELMMAYKPPLPNERPAPSVEDPEADGEAQEE